MALTREFPLHSHEVSHSRSKKYWKALIIVVFALTSASVPSARAQLQQPLVFSSAGAVASRNDQTGALTPVSGSPFTATNQSLVIDVQGRYLFALGTNSIRMFQISDATTGAYQEVTGSLSHRRSRISRPSLPSSLRGNTSPSSIASANIPAMVW
jgi:hypothetical protein